MGKSKTLIAWRLLSSHFSYSTGAHEFHMIFWGFSCLYSLKICKRRLMLKRVMFTIGVFSEAGSKMTFDKFWLWVFIKIYPLYFWRLFSFLDGLQRFVEIEYLVWFLLYCTHPFKCQTRHVCLSELLTRNRGGHLLFNLQRFQQFKNRQNVLSFSNCSQIFTNLNSYLWILVFGNIWQIHSCFILINFEKNRVIEKNVITV